MYTVLFVISVIDNIVFPILGQLDFPEDNYI